MYRDDDERSYQDKMDDKCFRGREPSEDAPFTFEDIAALVAFITLDVKDQDRHRLLAYFFSDNSWKKVCLKCRLDKNKWFRFRNKLMKRYKIFRRKYKYN